MIRSARFRAVATVAGVVWAGACGGAEDTVPEPAASDSAGPTEARPLIDPANWSDGPSRSARSSSSPKRAANPPAGSNVTSWR